ncbi:trypsin-like peptidase domain-containing protein [Ramlibacter albus]|uniref:Trypsin-like peptidase domain-containing protein n=1 Tax=Ramlibacter albus TaxID=2079448 RepID=A0A923MAR1_9BURK|nr:S1C family serine protease [Ramlibacter albus]MBC5765632.1 trypsin-like peptidase domain-containing protein [Ramlibacter albus]
MIDPLLFSTTRMSTFRGRQALTAATSFFFSRGERLFAVTSRHVLHDEPTGHFPDRVEIVLHIDATDLTRTVVQSIPLYRDGRAVWHQGVDSGGEVDIAVLELDRAALPEAHVLCAFEPRHLTVPEVGVGEPLLVPGFPLGFYDTVHYLPVVRQAITASPFGIRFQGEGYFLTDARMHRGSSGAPVVMRWAGAEAGERMPWRLLGVHAGRLDMGTRDLVQDETLGLNCAWYADILMKLTEDGALSSRAEMGPRPRAPQKP